MKQTITFCAVLAVTSLGAATFTNPVIDDDWPDPTIWHGGDGWYYSVATGLQTVRQSRNLVDWIDTKRSPLTSEARFALTNLTGKVWAPSVAKIGNRWVMHVSLFIDDADNRIQALVSDSPSGPFSFHGNVIDSRREGIINTIDPYAFVEDGHVWLFFGSCQDGIHRVELTPDGLGILPGSKPVHVAGHRRDHKNPKDLWGAPGAYEGSYVFRHKGFWYLFVSFGKFDNGTYCLTVGRATSVTGIFRDRQGRPLTEGLAEPILKGQPGARFFGPGHNGNIFTSPDGRTWMFYHAHDHKRARAADRPTLLQELKWTEDDWPFFDGDAPAETVDAGIPAGEISELSVDGIYPHLAMQNDEGECGTGAIVPWAGSLWVVTYGPHCPVGSSDKLYQITPGLKRIVRKESVGGTPANRLIHRETNQLLIGPYIIDAKGHVRVVPPAKMPGRLTGAARHLVDPANKVYVATMDNGLYSLDMRTLAVKTLQRDHNGEDGRIWGQKRDPRFPRTFDWDDAVENVLPGSHTKGVCSGFGRIQLANNGEYHKDALTNPWIPAGVLGDCAPDGRDQRVIRRCQFTDITTGDGIYGNEHPETNPIWSLGWDAKSVILAVTTNGTQWVYYRLPKASHCYDGAHGWNTEWPRIRDAGLGNGNLLATMHGTFWRFPKTFSPATPNGIRPISTYLKVIGDFCYWRDAPNGGSIVFGCDDHARCAFLGKRKLKADQPPNVRSTSNLWFVKPNDLANFGPPTGEGWVWHNEDVKAGDVSDPYLWAGYAERKFSFKDATGKDVQCELVHEGDWVRVKALADAKGCSAHFVYGLPKPATLPALDERRPFIDITDDNGRAFRFPNVNKDTRVICRELVTERDLLYVGGVFYEVPAENAGGFAALRPIALADEPVKSIAVDRGLIVVNGKRMALDALWKNGTAAQAYWLCREYVKCLQDACPMHR